MRKQELGLTHLIQPLFYPHLPMTFNDPRSGLSFNNVYLYVEMLDDIPLLWLGRLGKMELKSYKILLMGGQNGYAGCSQESR